MDQGDRRRCAHCPCRRGEVIDDRLIEAQAVAIDGPGGILGEAGPTNLRPAAAEDINRFFHEFAIIKLNAHVCHLEVAQRRKGSQGSHVFISKVEDITEGLPMPVARRRQEATHEHPQTIRTQTYLRGFVAPSAA